jgi:transposase-like protein
MKRNCPKCEAKDKSIIKSGYFKRLSDSKKIQRFKCKACGTYFSTATFSACYHQNKRRINPILRNSLCSSMSMRRFAKVYKISRTTVKRKLEFLATQARFNQKKWLNERLIPFKSVQFDDLETFEATKCKPLTVTLFVESKTRKIIDFSVASIGAKGHLAKVSRAKYGKRQNNSKNEREKLFKRLVPYVDEKAQITSDENMFYKPLVEKYFPKAQYRRFKGVKSRSNGLGELKKGGYDPLFSINHTFAMMRYGMSRLVRRTWCTTKSIKALEDHIALYVDFHNQVLT